MNIDHRLKTYAAAASAGATAVSGMAAADLVISTGAMTIEVGSGNVNLFTQDSDALWATNSARMTPSASFSLSAGLFADSISFNVGVNNGDVVSNTAGMAAGGLQVTSQFGFTGSPNELPLGDNMLVSFAMNTGVGTYYGWINYTIFNPDITEYSLTINAWAYNDTSGGAIVAGQNEVPGPGGLAVLASGAAGVRLRRRREER